MTEHSKGREAHSIPAQPSEKTKANFRNAKPDPAASLLTPQDSVVLLVDHQPQMFFSTTSTDRGSIINATVGLAKGAKIFNIPVILTTVASKTFSGPLLPQLAECFPGVSPIDRTTMNCWEDLRVADAVKATGRPKIVMAGLWTEVCIALAALSAVDQGYQVYVPTDACGGVTAEAHDNAVQRMLQHGVMPLTWLTTVLEWQRDWSRTQTYDAITAVIKEHAGAYGLGVIYAHAMLPGHMTAA
ncbi:hydrolase [Streptosporangium sp. H16]|uniref:hydrolase n=1 Tax=Streptosporangium sp. H16 TaxID=3444184 RepID=UPI003F79E565